ncbi:putative oxidoreductase YteT isoform X2 [Ylistrum balloti]|uniref:putative oxidoreductase YteT isoform X2 n=1 Tax=Ylistrum balloti TaxID=509963 RepID=UPI00290587CE|nr:putative oxidoreductase YteT isoform X2 [Ylistrum balloti]
MSKKQENSYLTAIVIGAGMRGSVYAQYAQIYPDRLKIIGVADPRKFYRRQLQQQFNIEDKNCFSDWSEASERDKMSDCVIITTPDRLHKDPAIAFAKKGYNILLEKPMAVNEEDCREIVKTCQENNVTLTVCHVLRYTPWAIKLRELIDSGIIGEVVNINHTEPVGFWHFAHSFVRGNWHNEAKSSSSLLAKCCHDIDLINFWMAGRRCTSLSSFGHLSHFNNESKPPGAANRCMECPADVESKCPYSAKKIYLDQIKQGDTGFPVCVIAEEPTMESVTAALKTGPYGVCVYDNDNDVMSNQVVNMQFEGGATATLTMMAFTKSVCTREVKVYGTKGELSCKATSAPVIQHFDFLTGVSHEYQAEPQMVKGMMGHGGADFHCIHSFVNSVANGDKTTISTGPEESLGSHLLVFAAEKARKEKRVVMLQPDGTYN